MASTKHPLRASSRHARFATQVAMLEYFAEQRQTSVSYVLARELEDLASAHFEELSMAVHGFAEAFEWLRQDATQRHADS